MSAAVERRARSSGSRWRQVLETSGLVYVALDVDGLVVDWNPFAARLFGVARDDVVGTPAERFVAEGSRDRYREGLGAAGGSRDVDVVPLELDLVDAAGRPFVGECLVWGVDRRGGTLVHCFFRDVTERRRTEQAAALLAAVVQGSADAVYTEVDGAIVNWNQAAERTFGWTSEQVVGACALVVVPPDRLDEHRALVRAVLAGDAVRGLETERRSRGGVDVPVALRMSPVHDAAGRVVAVSCTARDITEQQWMAQALDTTLQQLQGALEEAQASEASSRRFLADAAHQLRTPLAGVQACAELLLRGAPPAEQDRLLATMVRETSRSGRLITGLLRIARLDQGAPLPTGETDLVALCRDEVERLSLLAPHLEVAVELPGGPLPPLALDAASCHEILSNLGDNGGRHAARRLTFRVESGDGRARVSVLDDGPGVPDGRAESVFERFVSLDARGGSGLGLPIARGLARAMGGDLHYDAGFVLTLPLA